MPDIDLLDESIAVISDKLPEAEMTRRRYLLDKDHPEEARFYCFSKEGDSLSFTLSYPDAPHGVQVSSFDPSVADSYWVEEVNFTLKPDGSLTAEYADPDSGVVLSKSIDDVSAQLAIVVPASESFEYGELA